MSYHGEVAMVYNRKRNYKLYGAKYSGEDVLMHAKGIYNWVVVLCHSRHLVVKKLFPFR